MAAERLADRTVGYVLPFYEQFKVIMLLLMLAWRSVVSRPCRSLRLPELTMTLNREPRSSSREC